MGRGRIHAGLVDVGSVKPAVLVADSGHQFRIAGFNDNQGDGTLRGGVSQGWNKQFGGTRQVTAAEPCVMKGPATTIFGKNQTIGS